MRELTAVAPGRVNLIGDHTDYTGGLVLPMAIDRYTEIRGKRGGDRVHLTSVDEIEPVDIPLDIDRPQDVCPAWGRYVAGVVAEVVAAAPRTQGFRGRITTDIPVAAGLSSSAALEVAVALAIGFEGSALATALLCQRAEQAATGVPCGIMDQLTATSGVAEHALLIDCADLTITPVRVPAEAEIVVLVVTRRTLVGSSYADRVGECAAAERLLGPLRHATVASAARLTDPVLRARALHVTGENRRVLDFADALAAGDLAGAGHLMVASHNSLRDLYGTSTAAMDATVEKLEATPGVYGARMTGGGFGGCVVALTDPGALRHGWVVRAVDGARVLAA